MEMQNKYNIRLHFGEQIVIKSVWAENESDAQMQVFKWGLSQLSTSVETEKETKIRKTNEAIADLESRIHDAESWLHEWPEYMDQTPADRESRSELISTIYDLRHEKRELECRLTVIASC